jgi:uncharacterized protein (DUF2147 family)
MLRKILIAGAALLLSAAPALATQAMAAQPIEGDWLTLKKDTAHIAPCQAAAQSGQFCITLIDGTYAGKTIGVLKGSGGQYVGQVTDPADDKTYDGSATVTGKALKLQGCVMKIFCKSQVWMRK